MLEGCRPCPFLSASGPASKEQRSRLLQRTVLRAGLARTPMTRNFAQTPMPPGVRLWRLLTDRAASCLGSAQLGDAVGVAERAGSGGHTTSRNAEIGPRNAVRTNQYQGERFRVRAKPPARMATLSHIAETIDVRVATSCIVRRYPAPAARPILPDCARPRTGVRAGIRAAVGVVQPCRFPTGSTLWHVSRLT